MKVVLFDIDGTLLWSDGAGRRAMESALTDVFGSPGAPEYRYDGKTDRQIVRELMRSEGHADEHIDDRMTALLELYLAGLERELACGERRAHRFDGVLELIDAVESRPGYVLGLLTGNLEGGAARKLRSAEIDPERFVVCAYGSDHEVRAELPSVALRRARERLGLALPGSSLIIVGDTPADIACGRPVGARAIAVATGRYSVEELAAHEPHAVFPDLRDTDAVLCAMDAA